LHKSLPKITCMNGALDTPYHRPRKSSQFETCKFDASATAAATRAVAVAVVVVVEAVVVVAVVVAAVAAAVAGAVAAAATQQQHQ
jgi:hypothetical protein